MRNEKITIIKKNSGSLGRDFLVLSYRCFY
ncbi:hypothetical protein PAECIP111894_03977 [Paenibacillus pseudetheri]|uniref:Uncharacterized protein n=1 Tax=Paenibacillus pseudetheri TaxID=2897682 RepID=A0ABN8FIM7_9BACL|nr:hypothetical protein PAECIP111894_03977 [Paenibacillus pseudetheri]